MDAPQCGLVLAARTHAAAQYVERVGAATKAAVATAVDETDVLLADASARSAMRGYRAAWDTAPRGISCCWPLHVRSGLHINFNYVHVGSACWMLQAALHVASRVACCNLTRAQSSS